MRSLSSLLPALLIAGAMFAFGCFGVDSPQSSKVDASPPTFVAASPAPDVCTCADNSPTLAKHAAQIKQLQDAIDDTGRWKWIRAETDSPAAKAKAVTSLPVSESPPEKFTPPPPGLIVKPSLPVPVSKPAPKAVSAPVLQYQSCANGNCSTGGRLRFRRR